MTFSSPIMNAEWVRDIIYEIIVSLPMDGVYVERKYLPRKIGKIFGFYFQEKNRREKSRRTLLRVLNSLRKAYPSKKFIDAFLPHLLDFEWMAHTRFKPFGKGEYPKIYRDHILHPAAVCAIGWWMMSDQGIKEMNWKKIAGILEQNYGKDHPYITNWLDIARRAWVVASLCHDLLYPVEFLFKLNSEGVDLSPLISHSCIKKEEVKRIWEQCSENIFKKMISDDDLLEKIHDQKNIHSVLGALYLLGSKSVYSTEKDNKRKIVLELAASAILFHHPRNHEKEKICFKQHPLGCLLSLADNCHEFGREIMVWSLQKNNRLVKFIPPILQARIEKIEKHHYCIICKWNEDFPIKKLKTQGGFNQNKLQEDKKINFQFFICDPSFHGFSFNFDFEPS